MRKLKFSETTDASIEPSLGHRFVFGITRPYVEDKVILDVGCWTGSYISLIVNANSHMVVGIDIEKRALKVAKSATLNANFIMASVFNMPFRENTFDVITFWTVIEHLPVNKELNALCEIKRVLKKGGKLFMSTENDHILSKLLDPAYFLAGHRHYSIRRLAQLLTSANFKLENYFIKEGLFRCINLMIFYIFKHVLKKPLRRSIFGNLARSEYQRRGFNTLFIIASKTH